MIETEINLLIHQLRSLPRENEWVEFKENNVSPEIIGQYLSALSNTASILKQPFGYLVYGIEDTTHNVVGTKFRPKHTKVKGQEIENWLVTQLNPPIDIEILEENIEGKTVVVFKIEATKNTPVEFKKEAYVRVGSYKKKLSDHPEKARKIWIKTNEETFEKGEAVKGKTDDEILALIDYLTAFELLKQPVPDSKSAILEKLIEFKLVNKVKNKFNLTNLGGILFAVNLQNIEALSRKAVRVITYKGKNKIETIKEQVGQKGYASGFEGLINYINDRLPGNEEIGRVFRKEVKVYPEIAIRELVANALIHQDFSRTGSGPLVEIFSNRIEITNPGHPLIEPSRFIDHSPESRNEILAGLMRRMGICEERGSGIDKVIHSIELFQLPPIRIDTGENYTRITLSEPKSLNEMDRYEKVLAAYQHCCLMYVQREYMTNQSLRERFKVEEHNYATISRIIKEAIKERVLKEQDPNNKSRKYAKYVPIWA